MNITTKIASIALVATVSFSGVNVANSTEIP